SPTLTGKALKTLPAETLCSPSTRMSVTTKLSTVAAAAPAGAQKTASHSAQPRKCFMQDSLSLCVAATLFAQAWPGATCLLISYHTSPSPPLLPMPLEGGFKQGSNQSGFLASGRHQPNHPYSRARSL